MTRSPWTSNDQKEWLESRKTEYLAANMNNKAANETFPDIFKDFRKKWPVPPVTQEEIDEADGPIELATKNKRNKYDKVSILYLKNGMATNEVSAARQGMLS
jgi:hypothetical protein